MRSPSRWRCGCPALGRHYRVAIASDGAVRNRPRRTNVVRSEEPDRVVVRRLHMIAPPVTIEPAAPSDAALLANLLELYAHDLSDVFAIEPRVDGRFGYDKLPLYWSEPERRFPFLIRAGGKTVGFVLVTRGSPATDDPDVWDVAEFFVLRGHRRSGCGREAALLLWNRLRGRWIVRVAERNRGAMPFWASAIGVYTRGKFTTHLREAGGRTWRDFFFVSPAVE